MPRADHVVRCPFLDDQCPRNARRPPIDARRATAVLAKTAILAAGFWTISAQAQHVEPQNVPTPPAISAAAAQITDKSHIIGPAAKIAVQAELERQIISGVFEKELEDDFGPATVMSLRAAYARHLFAPIWTPEGIEELIDAVGDHFSFGIVIDDLTLKEIENYRTAHESDSVAARAAADIGLTVAYLRLAKAVSGGLADEGRSVTANDDAPNRTILTESVIEAGAGNVHESLEMLEPDHPQYSALKEAMESYRNIQESGGWLAIPGGALLRPGDRDPRVPGLRNRLAREGYDVTTRLTPAGAPNTAAPGAPAIALAPDIYDPVLESAVRRFQTRHGLEDDGIVGDKTLAALNESVLSKIERIAENLHRWRTQGDMGRVHVWANIPSFTAQGWSDGAPAISMRTIVGKPSRQTPEFSDEIETVVTNPRWYAPVSIVRRDKLPKLRKDPGYAERANFTIYERSTGRRVNAYSIDWTDPSSARRYRMVQQPGEDNALGQLKILFPNQYSVYLHGTPGKHLFEEAQRTFSSGCVRLEYPDEMAKWLAKYDPKLSATRIDETLESKTRKWMSLDKHIPVHITYNTVTQGDDGDIYFWRDIYKRGNGIEMATKFAPLYKRPVRRLVQNTDTGR